MVKKKLGYYRVYIRNVPMSVQTVAAWNVDDAKKEYKKMTRSDVYAKHLHVRKLKKVI